MAFTTGTQFEIRTTGNDTNGGGFAPGASGTDWSQQDNPRYAVTDAVTNGATTITSATANFGADVVGNIAYIAGGSANITPNWYQITGRTNSTTITIENRGAQPASGTGVTLRIGGALASPGGFCQMLSTVQGNAPNVVAWIRKGTYVISVNTNNVSNGKLGFDSGSGFVSHALIGYDTTRGDLTGTRPLIQCSSGVTGTLVRTHGYFNYGTNLINIELDGANQGVVGITAVTTNSGTAIFRDCIVRNCTTGIVGESGGGHFALRTQAINCTTGYSATETYLCEAISCTTGYQTTQSQQRMCKQPRRCVARNCTTGFNMQSVRTIENCLAIGCVTGFLNSASNADQPMYFGCIAMNCTGRGFDLANGGYNMSCASYNNAVANRIPPISGTNPSLWPFQTYNFITLTADPFVDSTNNDYRLNNVAGGGALLRNAMYTIPGQLLGDDTGPVPGVYGGGGGGAYSPIDNILIR